MQLIVANGKEKRSHSSISVSAFNKAQMTDAPAFMLDAENTEPSLGTADQCAWRV